MISKMLRESPELDYLPAAEREACQLRRRH
jgi:hypothetical protein